MAIARVQSKTGTAVASTTISLTMDSAPTNGNFLVIAIGTLSSSNDRVSSITQTNVTWTKAISVANSSIAESEVWYGVASASAGTGITVNLAAALTARCVVAEYSGVATSGALDKTASTTNIGGGAVLSGTTALTSYTIELWGASLVCAASFGTYGSFGSEPTNGFTRVAQVGDSTLLVELAEKIVSARATAFTSDTWSATSDSEVCAGTIATFSDPTFTTGRRIMVIS